VDSVPDVVDVDVNGVEVRATSVTGVAVGVAPVTGVVTVEISSANIV